MPPVRPTPPTPRGPLDGRGDDPPPLPRPAPAKPGRMCRAPRGACAAGKSYREGRPRVSQSPLSLSRQVGGPRAGDRALRLPRLGGRAGAPWPRRGAYRVPRAAPRPPLPAQAPQSPAPGASTSPPRRTLHLLRLMRGRHSTTRPLTSEPTLNLITRLPLLVRSRVLASTPGLRTTPLPLRLVPMNSHRGARRAEVLA